MGSKFGLGEGGDALEGVQEGKKLKGSGHSFGHMVKLSKQSLYKML